MYYSSFLYDNIIIRINTNQNPENFIGLMGAKKGNANAVRSYNYLQKDSAFMEEVVTFIFDVEYFDTEDATGRKMLKSYGALIYDPNNIFVDYLRDNSVDGLGTDVRVIDKKYPKEWKSISYSYDWN